MTYSRCAKEVLRDGLHFADAVSEDAAQAILEALQGPQPRPFHEWHEDIHDVLWWLWPIESAPYCGTPLDLGYTVEIETSLATSQRNGAPIELKGRAQVGGWPFAEEDEHRLYWTPLPSANALDESIRDDIRGGPDPFKESV